MIRVFFIFIMSLWMFGVSSAETLKPLPADKAFEFTSYMDQKNQLMLEWQIAPGYYLYRDHLHIKLVSPNQIKLEKIQLPIGKLKKDQLSTNSYQVYFGPLKIPVAFVSASDGIVNLNVTYQGCSAKGFCYAPIKKEIRIKVSPEDNIKNVIVTSEMPTLEISPQDKVENLLNGSSYFVIIMSFLGLGLLLAFTPCVLPMIPILSSIIVGQGKHLTTRKAFSLSLAYVLGMAITYAIAGMVVAMIGSSIQVLFQQTWIIILFSGLFVLLAFSLFGYYELQLPSRWQRKVTAMSDKQKSGTYFGVFIMGVLSSLIVSPCVSAPLVGVLAYIAQTGDMILGGLALLALGFGMGVPLLLIGTSAGKLLPKAGSWMEYVKKIFGFMLLAMSIWILSRVVPGAFSLFLWGTLAIFIAIFMGAFTRSQNRAEKILRTIGIVFLVYGLILIIGAVMGNSDPLHPWENTKIVEKPAPTFITVKDMQQLENELAAAKRAKKPVMLDFYADWCTACVTMDRYVFNQPELPMSKFVLLRADITQNNDFDQALLKKFGVVAPPTIIFFDKKGRELTKKRIVGEIGTAELKEKMEKLEQGK